MWSRWTPATVVNTFQLQRPDARPLHGQPCVLSPLLSHVRGQSDRDIFFSRWYSEWTEIERETGSPVTGGKREMDESVSPLSVPKLVRKKNRANRSPLSAVKRHLYKVHFSRHAAYYLYEICNSWNTIGVSRISDKEEIISILLYYTLILLQYSSWNMKYLNNYSYLWIFTYIHLSYVDVTW